MNLTAPSEVRDLLQRLDVHPSKVLGQNFLIDANILKILLSAAHLRQEDAVLEIGPGLGVLTEWLCRWSGRVVAIEKDRRLCAWLREHLAKAKNLELIEGDAMDVDLESLLASGVNKVVANLPYSVGSRVLVTLIESVHAPEQVVVTVQKEVARRLAAKPGTKDYALIGILAQLRYEVEVRKEVSPTCFFPPPEVTSAIVSMARRETAVPVDGDGLKSLLKTAFSQRRKQLGTILRKETPGAADVLASLGIDARTRPEDLNPVQWAALANALGPNRKP